MPSTRPVQVETSTTSAELWQVVRTAPLSRGDLDHFEQTYQNDIDPWNFTESPYVLRRFDITMASLPRLRYRRCFEPGCSIESLTIVIVNFVCPRGPRSRSSFRSSLRWGLRCVRWCSLVYGFGIGQTSPNRARRSRHVVSNSSKTRADAVRFACDRVLRYPTQRRTLNAH